MMNNIRQYWAPYALLTLLVIFGGCRFAETMPKAHAAEPATTAEITTIQEVGNGLYVWKSGLDTNYEPTSVFETDAKKFVEIYPHLRIIDIEVADSTVKNLSHPYSIPTVVYFTVGDPR
jgi:uncharacterized protein involved in tolerance to divalent cations